MCVLDCWMLLEVVGNAVGSCWKCIFFLMYQKFYVFLQRPTEMRVVGSVFGPSNTPKILIITPMIYLVGLLEGRNQKLHSWK